MITLKLSWKDKTFVGLNYIILGLFALICLYPFIYVLSASLSSGLSITEGRVWLLPIDFNLESYKEVINMDGIWTALGNTLFYTIVGVAVQLLFTIFGAYPMAKRDFKGGTFLAFFISFTMWFNAGMIPTYLNFVDLNLLDTNPCKSTYVTLYTWDSKVNKTLIYRFTLAVSPRFYDYENQGTSTSANILIIKKCLLEF